MTRELEPCPFCGKTPQANEVFRERGVWKADVCCWGCGYAIAYYAPSRQDAEHMAAHKWNTRYKRTCTPLLSSYWVPKTMEELPGDFEAPVIVCSECEHEISFDETYDPETDFPTFCEKCGCKIVGPVKEYQ